MVIERCGLKEVRRVMTIMPLSGLGYCADWEVSGSCRGGGGLERGGIPGEVLLSSYQTEPDWCLDFRLDGVWRREG